MRLALRSLEVPVNIKTKQGGVLSVQRDAVDSKRCIAFGASGSVEFDGTWWLLWECIYRGYFEEVRG